LKVVSSFDIFDTLVARRVARPEDIFRIVEHKSGYPDFFNLRVMAAKSSDGTFDGIYYQFQQATSCSHTEVLRLRQIEVETEIENLYLIPSIYALVKDGDILLSDMYLPPDILTKMLFTIGFRKPVTVFASPSGKATGVAWAYLQQTYAIQRHYGDNVHSDVFMPQQYGIPAHHVNISSMTAVEEVIMTRCGAKELSLFLREFRLSNPNPDPESPLYLLYDAQIQKNLPLMLGFAYHLYRLCQEEGLTRVLFTTRDGGTIQRIFEVLYPDIEAVRFHASRAAYTTAHPQYIEYVKSVYHEKAIIFDLVGAFKTGREFFTKHIGHMPRVYLGDYLSVRAPIIDGQVTYMFENSVLVNWELLNTDVVGSLITVMDGKDIRTPLEYDLRWVRYQQRVVDDFINYIKRAREMVVASLPKLTLEFWPFFLMSAIEDARVWNLNLFDVRRMHHKSLTEFANENMSDKGDGYGDAHHYTQYYEFIFANFSKNERVDLLEIGINRFAGPLRVFDGYFGPDRIFMTGKCD